MKKIYLLFLLGLFFQIKAQKFEGQVFLRDRSALYLNQVFVTNLTTYKTVLANYNGAFSIDGKPGDKVRFTSIVTERYDAKIDEKALNQKNIIELKIAYHDIQEVIISSFRPTGNLRYDVNSLRREDKAYTLKKVIGLPTPKGDGTPTELPVADFRDGGLTFSLESIYDILSGERKKKERLAAYQRMNNSVEKISNYLGKDYFLKLKIPENLIINFLQFVYTSENIESYIQAGQIEYVKIPIEKYVPIYQRRVKNSQLESILK